MLLREILKIDKLPEEHFDMEREFIQKLKNLKLIGQADGRDVFTATRRKDEVIFCSAENVGETKNITAFIYLQKAKVHGISGYILRRSWTRKDLRSKGYVMALVDFVLKYFKKPIISDEKHTEYARNFWKSAIQKGRGVMAITDDGKKPATLKDFNSYYTTKFQNQADILLMIEGYSRRGFSRPTPDLSVMPSFGKGDA